MIDFDDIDEVAADRAAAGELDEVAAMALGKVEAPDLFKGGYLWSIPRNTQFPDFDVLPERMQASFPHKHKMLRMRLIVFYGAGDSFPFWTQFLYEDVPDWVDAAVYEWPSHGSREDEVLPALVDDVVADAMVGLERTFEQHAKGGDLEGAPFALVGHSIGVLLMLGVAAKAKTLYGLEPAAVFVLDRSAPQHRLCSEQGMQVLETDAAEFVRIFNPQPWILHEKAKARDGDQDGKTKRMLQMWMDDIKLQNQVKPEVWHTFKCPVHVFIATKNWEFDNAKVDAKAKMDVNLRSWHEERSTILNSKEASAALWDYEMYEDWRSWATSGQCHFHDIDADHVELRRKKEFLDTMWRVLGGLKASLSTD